jgi:hypothetical protein
LHTNAGKNVGTVVELMMVKSVKNFDFQYLPTICVPRNPRQTNYLLVVIVVVVVAVVVVAVVVVV